MPLGPVVLVPNVDGFPIAPVVEPPVLKGCAPSVPGMPPVIVLPVAFGVPPSVPGIPPVMDGVTLGETPVGLVNDPGDVNVLPVVCAMAGAAMSAPAATVAMKMLYRCMCAS